MAERSQPQPFQFGLQAVFALTTMAAALVGSFRFGGAYGVFFTCLAALMAAAAADWAKWNPVKAVCIGALLSVLLLAFLAPAFEANRRDPMRSASQNNLKQIGLSLSNYHDLHGCLPPAVVYDAHGQPLHSWRTLLLPYMEETQLYNAIRLNEPWNSPHNRQLMSGPAPPCYLNPQDSGQDPRNTGYVALVSADSLWSGQDGAKLDEATDGAEHTLLIIEMKNSGIPWAEPRDLDLDNLPPGIDKRKLVEAISPHKRSICAVHADGHVEVIPLDASIAELKAGASKSGGDRVDFQRSRRRIQPTVPAAASD